jgi:hypothetical protein
MDINRLHTLFMAAAETDRKLPPAIRKAKLSSWPDYPLDWHGYGWTQQGITVLKPTMQEIDDFDAALEMTTLMPEEDRKLVWAVAHSAAFRHRGAQWSKIARLLGLHDPRKVRRGYQDALIRLYYKLSDE